MPTNAFQGRTYGNFRNVRFDEVILANAGFAFNHATEAMTIGLTEPRKLEVKPHLIEGNDKRQHVNAYDVSMTIPALQTDIPALKNLYLLSKAPMQARIKDQNGEYLNFVENTSTPDSPNGSSLLTLGYKITIEEDKRGAEIMLKRRLFPNEMQWLWDNRTASTGGTSGTSLGLTAHSYDRTKFRESNFTSIKIDSVEVGEFKTPKIELESQGVEDYRKGVIAQKLMAKCEVTMLQTAEADLLAAWSAGKEDVTVEFITPVGETWKFTSGAVSVVPETTISEEENMIKLMLQGEIPYNYDEGSPNAVDWGVSSANVVEFLLI